jgi:hypothetical protein
MTGNLHAFQAPAWTREMTVVGNVLNQDIVNEGAQPVYQKTGHDPFYAAAIYRLGDNLWYGDTWDGPGYGPVPPQNIGSDGTSSLRAEDVLRLQAYPLTVAAPTFTTRAVDKIYRHGNWDSLTQSVIWEPANSMRSLPNSLFLTSKPAFFGNLAWPWINPLGATPADRVKTLPAKDRYDRGVPNE